MSTYVKPQVQPLANNPMRFKGQIVLITAATQGIGLATAIRIAMEGGIVHICSRSEDNVSAAVEQFKKEGFHITGHVCDISDDVSRRAMLDKIN